ncbi:hypothetical protein EYF80_052201 [Liparis tanakae]|uniref:Uncharacterized protein n=1 Tax=Liparis tanakae TaxID=230148 RepID=A0A4Z2FA21_9TELE|nr:hypothetical protein EYF80_052201 [Liparis tanakae]
MCFWRETTTHYSSCKRSTQAADTAARPRLKEEAPRPAARLHLQPAAGGEEGGEAAAGGGGTSESGSRPLKERVGCNGSDSL